MCSARSQRWTVETDMFETIRLAFASSANARQDQRDSGFPHALGSVQARAVIWARTLEGKKARGSRAFPVLNGPVNAPALAPVAHGTGCASHSSGNALVRPLRMVMGGHEHLGAHDLDMGRVSQSGDGKYLGIIGFVEVDPVNRLGSPRHRGSTSLWTQRTKQIFMTQKPGTNL